MGDEENIEIADGKVHIPKGLNNKLVAGDEAWSDFRWKRKSRWGRMAWIPAMQAYYSFYTGRLLAPISLPWLLWHRVEGAEHGKANGGWTRFGEKT